MVACWPVPKARLASISNAMLPAGAEPRWVGVWTKKRPARIGCSPAWLIVTQSSSPSCSICGCAAAEPASAAQLVGRRLMVEIGVDQPLVGPGRVGLVGDQHRRVVANPETAPPSSGSASALRARARQGRPASSLARRFLRQPLVERLALRRGIVAARRCCSPAARCRSAARSCCCADGCGVSRMSHSSAATLARLGAKGGDIGGMIAEPVIVAADRRQAVGIDHPVGTPRRRSCPNASSARLAYGPASRSAVSIRLPSRTVLAVA